MASQYDIDANFDKNDLISFVEKVRQHLHKEGVTAILWSIDSWSFTLQIQTGRKDQSDLIYAIYKFSEVQKVVTTCDGVVKSLLFHVVMKENWFLGRGDEKKEASKKRHPEEEGGSFA